ncbi:MAG: RCC1 repeat-containing protein, partial [Acidimicrobiia bacterium]|nr:RCC1 repeat-containing protein [Acidimicrobiia bacterium]
MRPKRARRRAGALAVTAAVVGGTLIPLGAARASATTGVVIGWGDGSSSELGTANSTSTANAVAIRNIGAVSALAAGDSFHTVALRPDGSVWTWGSNVYGDLGDGTTTDRATPVQPAGLGTAIGVAAGFVDSFAVRSDGTVWGWGGNQYGNLGDGTTTDRSTPVQVSGLSGVTAVSSALYTTMALRSDGTVWDWGNNSSGELGNGTTNPPQSASPVQVSSLSGVTAIAAGQDFGLGLRPDGTVWGWGNDGSGGLGDAAQ